VKKILAILLCSVLAAPAGLFAQQPAQTSNQQQAQVEQPGAAQASAAGTGGLGLPVLIAVAAVVVMAVVAVNDDPDDLVTAPASGTK